MTRSTTFDSVPRGEYVPTADHRVVLHGLSWSDFERFVELRGEDAAGPRVTFHNGVLELMSPSRDHETIIERLREVVRAYMDHIGMAYEGVGSWLLRHAPSATGLEPDDCYILGDLRATHPDLAIEVIWTSGGIDKLDIYRSLGVAEVWFWKNETLQFFSLHTDGYEEIAGSKLVPGFDPSLVREMLQLDRVSDVRRELRKRFG